MGDRLVIGCGYLGRRVAALWQAQGHRVYVTTRHEQMLSEFRQAGWEPLVCDVLAPDSLKALPPAETVLYCVGFDRSQDRSMREVYLDGLHHFCVLGPTSPRLLYVSSTGVYGQTQGEEVDETSPAEPTDESGRIIREAETELRSRRPEALVLRFAGIYGPGRLLRLPGLAAGQPLVGDANRWLNLIHVEDGAAAVLAAEARGRPGRVYNVSDDRPVRRGEFYEFLAALMGVPPPQFVAPRPDDPPPRRPLAHRRISNRRMRHELQTALRYPSYLEGLPAALAPGP